MDLLCFFLNVDVVSAVVGGNGGDGGGDVDDKAPPVEESGKITADRASFPNSLFSLGSISFFTGAWRCVDVKDPADFGRSPSSLR